MICLLMLNHQKKVGMKIILEINFKEMQLNEVIKNLDDKDLIMISDIDEIPNPKKIDEFNIKNKFACFLQKNFQSKIKFIKYNR